MVLDFLVVNIIPACASLLCWGMGNICSSNERVIKVLLALKGLEFPETICGRPVLKAGREDGQSVAWLVK